MKYLSTFTGIGGFEKAIHNIIPNAKCVGYSEYDKFANQTYEKNFPQHKGKNLGNIERLVFDIDSKGKLVVNEARVRLLPDFDLLIGGPPCQDLSIAKGNRQGLAGEKSRLFFAYLEILRIKKPKYFLMENVNSMSKEARETINELLGVECEVINSDKFTPQKRIRNYWFNWDLPELPKEDGPRRSKLLVAWSRSTRYRCDKTGKVYSKKAEGRTSFVEQRKTRDGRANTLTTGRGCGSFSSKNYIEGGDETGRSYERILTPNECEPLQGFPIGWTNGVSLGQQYKQIGNAVNVPTIEHILKGVEKQIRLI